MKLDDDLQAFARVQSALARPFASRDAVLAGAGIDEDGFRRLQARWLARLAGEDTGELRKAFCAAFAGEAVVDAAVVHTAVEAVVEVAPGEREEAPVRVVPSYLQAEGQANRQLLDASARLEQRLESYRGAGADATLDPLLSPEPTLPFLEGQAGVVPAAVLALKGAATDAPARREDADVEETLWFPAAVETGPATPFEAGSEPPMPLEKYAHFLALFGRNPEDADALRVQFGIASQEAQQALGRAFAERFAADPTERERFAALIKRVQHGGGQ